MNQIEANGGCRCGGSAPIRISGVQLRSAAPRIGGMTAQASGAQVSCGEDNGRRSGGCIQNSPCAAVKDNPLAMAYVPMQVFEDLYDPCTALIAGTVFASLDKPFCGETVSASAYPTPPAKPCSCGIQRGGYAHG